MRWADSLYIHESSVEDAHSKIDVLPTDAYFIDTCQGTLEMPAEAKDFLCLLAS